MLRVILWVFISSYHLEASSCNRWNKDQLIKEIIENHGLSEWQADAVSQIIRKSRYIGQGNPAITKHPVCREDCLQRLEKVGGQEDKLFKKICGRSHMAPLYDPSHQQASDAAVCIDQYEFPNIPCAYPVVWVRASEAAMICKALGKRMCDAHEWEGACAGSLKNPDYDFTSQATREPSDAIRILRRKHNFNIKKVWSYGDKFRRGICAQNSQKSLNCNGGDWKKCGSNTYPSGNFPNCKSRLEVFDLHGNAAEHMNLPLALDQMASNDSLGYTEMKGSWFIWDKFQAHPDHCRWRAPFWHGTRVQDKKSHHNYHLGFRCCASISASRK